MEDREPRKKRRDSLEDQLGHDLFTEDAVPPFITSTEDFIWCCFRADRQAASALLPAGLRPTDPVTVHLAIFRYGPGWGLAHTSGGFLCLVIDGYDSPDTGEAAFILGGFLDEPDRTRLNRHFAPFAPGHSTFRRAGRDLHHELWSAAGLVARVHSRITDEPSTNGASQDRYLGQGEGADLRSFIVSNTSTTQPCDLLSLEFGPAAPKDFLALQPTELCWSLFLPFMLTNFSAPEPLVRDDVPRAASQEALMATLERLGRAACILSAEGRILRQNVSAAALLAGGTGRIDPGPQGGAGGKGILAPLQIRRRAGQAPLIAQLMPLDPDLAGPGARLALLTDPTAARRATPRVELLQLLNLTPAEARVASLVGSGLPPREAGVRLGLTEATVRSTLKVVFSKLGVRRQSELVQLVGRLDPG